MFRTMIAAAAALTCVAPALAQDSDLLIGEPWECRTVSLVGDPTGELLIQFDEAGDTYIAFYMEMKVEETTIAVEFDLSGTWSADGNVISIHSTDFSMVNAWVDGKEMEFDAATALGADLEEEFADYGGQNTIAFISEHALVLEEPETSISCWR